MSAVVGFAKLRERREEMIGGFHEKGRECAVGVKIDGGNFV